MKLIKFPISQFYVSQDMKSTSKKIILRCKLFINKRSEILYDIAVSTVDTVYLLWNNSVLNPWKTANWHYRNISLAESRFLLLLIG